MSIPQQSTIQPLKVLDAAETCLQFCSLNESPFLQRVLASVRDAFKRLSKRPSRKSSKLLSVTAQIPSENEKELRILRDWIRSNQEDLVQAAYAQLGGEPDHKKGLHLDWVDSRKDGAAPPIQMTGEVESLLRQAYSLRILDAALTCQLMADAKRNDMVEQIVELILIVLGPRDAKSVCEAILIVSE